MIKQKTTLILGAGASNAYGFPLGRGLRDLVCNKPGDNISRAIEMAGYSTDEMTDFISTLQLSGYTSVDWFLEDNPDYIHIGKAVIASCLIPFETSEKLFPPNSPSEHWYELLINLMATPVEEFQENNLSIITFNYDRSLEYYFLKVLETRLNSHQKAIELLSSLKILHVHGSLGELNSATNIGREYAPVVTPESIATAANDIIIVGEADDDSKSFEQARDLLNNSERVIFLGFGFHPESVRRLGIFNDPWDEEKRHRIRVGGTSRAVPLHIWNNIQENILNGAFPARGRSVHSVYKHLNEAEPLGL